MAGAADSVILRLRTESAEQHKRLEDLLDLLSPSLDRPRYLAVLRAFAAFYTPMMRQLDVVVADANLADDLDWPVRRTKAERLAADLRELGEPLPEEVPPSAMPVVDDRSSALGALYVLEGATLGGRQMLPHLRATLGTEQGTSFFASYGDDVPVRWQHFRRVINAAAQSGADVTAMSKSAALTFAALEQACRRELRTS